MFSELKYSVKTKELKKLIIDFTLQEQPIFAAGRLITLTPCRSIALLSKHGRSEIIDYRTSKTPIRINLIDFDNIILCSETEIMGLLRGKLRKLNLNKINDLPTKIFSPEKEGDIIESVAALGNNKFAIAYQGSLSGIIIFELHNNKLVKVMELPFIVALPNKELIKLLENPAQINLKTLNQYLVIMHGTPRNTVIFFLNKDTFEPLRAVNLPKRELNKIDLLPDGKTFVLSQDYRNQTMFHLLDIEYELIEPYPINFRDLFVKSNGHIIAQKAKEHRVKGITNDTIDHQMSTIEFERFTQARTNRKHNLIAVVLNTTSILRELTEIIISYIIENEVPLTITPPTDQVTNNSYYSKENSFFFNPKKIIQHNTIDKKPEQVLTA